MTEPLFQPRAARNGYARAVDEFVLLEHCRCPARSPHGAPRPVFDQVADEVLRWLSWEATERELPSLPKTREKAEHLYFKLETQMPDAAGLKLVRLSKRLHDLVAFHRVMHPCEPYRLEFGASAITGNLVVMQPNRAVDHGYVVRLRSGLKRWAPDVVGAARWLFAKRESGYSKVSLADYWYDSFTRKDSIFDVPRVERWLGSAAAGWNAGHCYPNPGPHCEGCGRICVA